MKYKLQTSQGFARKTDLSQLSQKRRNTNLLGLMLPLFVMLFFQVSLQAQNIPIPITPNSFNFDAVAEAAPPSAYTTSAMPGNDVIYSDTYPGSQSTTGMPSSLTISNGTVTYDVQPYNVYNTLHLYGVPATTGSNASGNLIFQTPTALETVHLAVFSVFGSSDITVVATFSDGTTEQLVTNFTVADWFNGSSAVHILNGRTTYSGQVYNLNSGNPRIYTYDFNISAANQSKTITKLDLTRSGGPVQSRVYFFGVAGKPKSLFNVDLDVSDICSSEDEWLVPIDVDSIPSDISSVDLVLDYDNTKMAYGGVTGNAKLNTATNPIAVTDNNGKLTISWSNAAGASIIKETLMTLRFIPAGGAATFAGLSGQTVDFTWDLSPGNCEISDLSNNVIYAAYNDKTGAQYRACNSFSGTVVYDDMPQTPFSNVNIIATGTGLQPDTFATDPADGSFSLENLFDGVTYSLTYNSTDMHGGSNATDALYVLLDTSNAIFLFGLNALAADVNNDNMLTGADVSEIQSRFVSNSVTSFSSNQDWVFDLSLLSLFGISLSNEKIFGRAMGDIDGSLHTSSDTINSVTDTFITVNDGDRILMPIRLKQAENIGAMSLVMNIPSNAVTVHDVMLEDNTPIMNEVDGDELRAAWSGLNFQHLAADDVLFYIDVTIDDVAAYGASPISFSQETELADSTAKVIQSVMLGVPDVFVTNTNTIEESAINVRNFPNPVADQMTIEYNLTATSDVSIQIFNALGQEVTQLVNETQQAGVNRAIWNAKSQAAGVYFYTITVTEGGQTYQDTKQVVIVK